MAETLLERDATSAFQAFIVGFSKMDEEGVSAIITLDDMNGEPWC